MPPSASDPPQRRDTPSANGELPGPSTAVHWTFFILSAVVLLLALVLRVRDERQVVVPVAGLALPEMCAMRRFTGMNCPGCGLTRCFIRLAHGDVAGAWMYNPAGILLFGIVAFQVPYRLFQVARIRRGLEEHHFTAADEWIIIAMSLLLIAQWCVRLIL